MSSPVGQAVLRRVQKKRGVTMPKGHDIPVTSTCRGRQPGHLRPTPEGHPHRAGGPGGGLPLRGGRALTGDDGIQAINREMRKVDAPTDVLSFPEFELRPGELPGPEDADPGCGLVPLGGHGHFHGTVSRPRRGNTTTQAQGAVLSHCPLSAPSAGVRPSGRGADEGPDESAGRGHFGKPGNRQRSG